MEQENVWPPKGFKTFYQMTEAVAGRPQVRYDMVLPGGFAEVDLSTIRLGRHSGPNAADERFRAKLHRHVGAVVVAAGHVESALKRLLLVLEAPEKAHFSAVDETWTTLHKKLRRHCDGKDARRVGLAAVLAWSEEQGLKRRRDNVVHADWWDYVGCGVRRSRFIRGGNGTMILGSWRELVEDARLLGEYADRLDRLLGNDWIIARLPGPMTLRSGAHAANQEQPEHPNA